MLFRTLRIRLLLLFLFFFFNDTATTEIYTLSLHDALPISSYRCSSSESSCWPALQPGRVSFMAARKPPVRSRGSSRSTRSEEHTSELQSPCNLVCRLLLEKKKKNNQVNTTVH